MALSAAHGDIGSGISDFEKGVPLSLEVVNAAVIYNGALCSFDTTTGGIKPFDGTKADQIAGWHFGDTITGDTSANPKVRAAIYTGPGVWRNLTVAGLAGTVADQGKPVWATDDGTYTVTDPSSTGAEVGTVGKWISATKCDVKMNDVYGHIDP